MTDELDPPLRATSQPTPPLEAGVGFRAEAEYRLLRHMGTGGMGEVWHARRVSAGGHGHDVALKFLTLADEESERGLAREALHMAELSHDNIVGFVDSGHAGNEAYFIAMEYVRGLDLDGFLELHGLSYPNILAGAGELRVPCSIVGFILFMVCRALHHAHTRRFSSDQVGLFHRDISPGNVLIEEENGFIKLSDFGVASTTAAAATQTGISGKIPYAAPEELYQEGFDGRTDIYSLGLVGYELMTGFNPNRALVERQNAMAQLSHALICLDEPVTPPGEVVEGIDLALGKIVLRMLERAPAARYPTVDDLMRDLRVYLFSGGIGPTTDGLSHYLEHLRHPEKKIDTWSRACLVFLRPRGSRNPKLRLPWKLTPTAAAKVRDGVNPARCG